MKMYAELERKICSRCKVSKALSQFYRSSELKSGYQNYCKDCKNQRRRELSEKNREHYQAYERARQYKRYYGITVEQYDELWQLQDGRCLICNKHQRDCKRSLAVDHCHETKVIRGLLCDNCNPGLGYFKNSIELLKAAITYLEKFKN